MAGLTAEFPLDRQRGQESHLAVLSEGAGTVQQLARVANPAGIEVYSSGGFDSLAEKHRLSRLWARWDPPITVLHVGDYDPSGLSLFDNLNAAAYRLGDLEFIRVALTKEQAQDFNFPTAPPIPTDNRRFEGNETWRAEAIDARDLAAVVRASIEDRIGRGIYVAALEEEDEARRAVLSRLRDLEET